MSGLTSTQAGKLIDASNATSTLTAAVSPMKLRLNTAAATATAAGTEVTGGSYTSQTYAAAAASGTPAQASNSGIISYTSMPAVTVVGVDMYDSAGTPIRWWWGPLTANKTTNSGDTLSFAIGAVVQQISS